MPSPGWHASMNWQNACSPPLFSGNAACQPWQIAELSLETALNLTLISALHDPVHL